jgi:hypothetical protein
MVPLQPALSTLMQEGFITLDHSMLLDHVSHSCSVSACFCEGFGFGSVQRAQQGGSPKRSTTRRIRTSTRPRTTTQNSKPSSSALTGSCPDQEVVQEEQATTPHEIPSGWTRSKLKHQFYEEDLRENLWAEAQGQFL